MKAFSTDLSKNYKFKTIFETIPVSPSHFKTAFQKFLGQKTTLSGNKSELNFFNSQSYHDQKNNKI
jgi:hypothetical protein